MGLLFKNGRKLQQGKEFSFLGGEFHMLVTDGEGLLLSVELEFANLTQCVVLVLLTHYATEDSLDTENHHIKGIRLKEVPKVMLNEDSTVFTSRTVEHGLLAFRRSLAVGKWNSLIVPFDLTGKQVRDAFGDDCVVAKVKGVTNGEEVILEFDTVD